MQTHRVPLFMLWIAISASGFHRHSPENFGGEASHSPGLWESTLPMFQKWAAVSAAARRSSGFL